MAAWLFGEAARLPAQLTERRAAELTDTLGIDDDELASWDELSRKLIVPFHDDGVISQFEGYDELEELDWEGYRAKYGDIHRLDRILEAENDTPNRFKLSKQADAVMLFYVFAREELEAVLGRLGYELRPEQVTATVDYYLERTSHGSTLSDAVFAWALAREGRDDAYARFVRALRSDVDDIQGGTTPEGIHLGAMTSGVDLLQRCFTGLEHRDGVLALDPRWPAQLGPIDVDFAYRGHPLRLELARGRARLSSRSDKAAPVQVRRGAEVDRARGRRRGRVRLTRRRPGARRGRAAQSTRTPRDSAARRPVRERRPRREEGAGGIAAGALQVRGRRLESRRPLVHLSVTYWTRCGSSFQRLALEERHRDPAVLQLGHREGVERGVGLRVVDDALHLAVGLPDLHPNEVAQVLAVVDDGEQELVAADPVELALTADPALTAVDRHPVELLRDEALVAEAEQHLAARELALELVLDVGGDTGFAGPGGVVEGARHRQGAGLAVDDHGVLEVVPADPAVGVGHGHLHRVQAGGLVLVLADHEALRALAVVLARRWCPAR